MTPPPDSDSAVSGYHRAWRPRSGSIRKKLNFILLATTFVAMVLAGLALMVFDWRTQLLSLEKDLEIQAQIIGLASTTALVFEDRVVAAESLSVLSAQPEVGAAALYDARGKLFASFLPDGRSVLSLPPLAQPASVAADSEWVTVWRPVVSGHEVVGTIYLQSRHRLRGRMLEYFGVLCLILGGSMGTALLLSNRLQSSLTGPLLAVSDVARRILRKQDFTLRASRTTDDEIGTLVDLFNAMLDELGHRAEVLERANNALRISDERFQLAVRGSSAGLWDWDMPAHTTFYSPRFKALLGYSHEEFPDKPGSLAGIIHPDDRASVREALRQHLSFDKPYQIECRLRLKSGEWRWFLIAGMAQKNQLGGAFRMAGSVIDVTERKLAEQVLHDANRAKDEFLATLAHELRNPLAPIRTSLQILKRDTGNGLPSARAREIMERQLAHMVRLIDDLLDISRINSGKISIERRRVNLSGIIDTALEISRPLIEAKQHRLTVHLPEVDIWMMADATRLAQTVGNLLNNAAKYTSEGGLIELHAWQDGTTVVIEVRDNGVGIPQHMVESVFSLFTQVGRTLDRSQGGLGIGLYLVRSLVELHGGSVSVHSDPARPGSIFTVCLPCLPAEPPALPDVAWADAAATSAGAPSKPLRVLVVDDNIDAAVTLQAVLEMDGHTTCVVHEGQLVLAAARAFLPDVVLLDIGLPGMSGYEVAQQLRAEPQFRQTLLVAVTGWGSESDRRRATEAGFDRHLTKPVDLSVVEAILGEAAASAPNAVPGNEPGSAAR